MTEPESKKSYILPIRRPVSTVMLFLTMVVFGWKSYQQLSIDLMPNISYPTLTVRTEFEGAAPADVEELLTRPLEETLSTVGGMVQISSVSSPGLSEVILEYTWDSDMNTAQQDVRDRLDLYTPPDGVSEKPVILRYDPTLDPVMRVAITGSTVDDPQRAQEELTVIRDIADRQIKGDLEGELGIAQVLVKGGREEEIQVRLDAPRLKNLGITPANVVTALAQQNINLAGGRLKEGKTEYLVRTVNEFKTVEEIRDTIIPNPSSRQIRVRDVAEVLTGEKDRDTLVRINGVEAVELAIFKWGDANTVEVCNKLKDLLGFDRKHTVLESIIRSYKESMASSGLSKKDSELEYEEELAKTIQSRMPDFANMTLISDQSAFIIAAIDEVKGSAIMGGLLALLILFFFLRELRTTLVIGVAIPISIVATFVPMFLMDISLNIMSLGGIALGVGMLVDDSIIVLESIFRCQEEGDSRLDAVDRGTREVMTADAASTFTTIAVFLPIAFVEGVAGQLFRDLALTVTFSLLASLAVALYLNPMMMAHSRFDLSGTRSTLWMLRAWREGRNAGKGRMHALAGIFPVAFTRYTLDWLRRHGAATFAPLAHTYNTAFTKTPGTVPRLVRWMLMVVLVPQALTLILLFSLQILLKTLAVILITGISVITLFIALVLWGASKVLMLVLWLPLMLFEVVFNACRDAYTVALRATLPFGPIFLIITIVLSIHAGYIAYGLGRELIPPLKQGEFGIRMEAPPGTRLEQTALQAGPIEQAALSVPEIETVAMAVGSDSTSSDRERGENTAEFTVRLRNPKENAARQDEIIASLRDKVQGLTTNPIAFTLPTLFSFKTAIELQVRGDDLNELRRIGTAARNAIVDIPGLKDPELTMKRGYPEVIIRMDPVQLAERGVTADQVAQRLRTEVQGDVSTRFSRGGEKVDIRVLTDRARLNSLQDLQSLSITEGDRPIPLASVAEIRVEDGPSEIRRIDQRQVAVITANVEGRDLGTVARDIEARIQSIPRPRDYQFVLGGQNRELAASYKSLQFALILAIFLVYVVMACQFESLHHPALVMFSVPLAFIGVVYGLLLLDIPVSIMVFIGGIVLAGIVVNDAIILVDYINQLRARGMSKREAVILAGRVRMRPILMTTLTTILGLIPMALAGTEGAEIRRPMAVTIIAGEISSTLLILFLIPMLYDLLGGRDRT